MARVHAERKRSGCLQKEVGGIIQGTPDSDLDPLTAAEQEQSNLLLH